MPHTWFPAVALLVRRAAAGRPRAHAPPGSLRLRREAACPRPSWFSTPPPGGHGCPGPPRRPREAVALLVTRASARKPCCSLFPTPGSPHPLKAVRPASLAPYQLARIGPVVDCFLRAVAATPGEISLQVGSAAWPNPLQHEAQAPSLAAGRCA